MRDTRHRTEIEKALFRLGGTDEPICQSRNVSIPIGLLIAMVVYSFASVLADPSTSAVLDGLQSTNRYPTSFSNLWYSFALALFSYSAICSVAAAMVLDDIHCITKNRIDWTDSAHVYLRKQMSIYFCVFLMAIGDAAALLMWGEVSGTTLETVQLSDRILDFVAIVPFLYYVWLRTRAQPVALYYLQSKPPIDLRPTFAMVRRHGAMVSVCLLVALLVALSK